MPTGSENKAAWRQRKRDQGYSWTDINGPGRTGAGERERYYNSRNDDCCFPKDALVTLADGTLVEMHCLKIGDEVVSQDAEGSASFTEICAFAHADPDAIAMFKVISLCSGTQITLSFDHLIPVHRESKAGQRRFDYVRAQDVSRGDVLFTKKGDATVVVIREEERQGLYAPITMAGTLLVNDIVASCYAVLHHHQIFHLAMAPVRFVHANSKLVTSIGHRLGGSRLKGAHAYIDILSYLSPVVRFFMI